MITMTKRLKLTAPLWVIGLVLSGCGFFALFDEAIAIAQTSSCSYPIVDTGQSKTYDNANALAIEPSVGLAFYGQDAQIDGNQPRYVDHRDGTVTDLVTGLMWQQSYSGKMSQGEAAAGASDFNVAGYTDWRLPTIKELYSLILFNGEDVSPTASSADTPFIDRTVFDFEYGNTASGERIIDSQWATSTIYVASALMFGVNFADGRIKGYGLTDPRGGDMQFYVRYVRGNTAYGENEFINHGDGTISDLATGLMWSQDDSGYGMDWEDALAYVRALNDQSYLGYSDWHLPNAKELHSIVDYTRSPDSTNSAAIDPVFNVTSITNEAGQMDWAYYWTSTTHASARGGEAAVYIAFGRGLGYMSNRYVDVHGAGCQRSDPKSGSAIPTGRGPQGDVVRVRNFVRAVRVAVGVSSDSNNDTSSSNMSIGEPSDSQSSPPPGTSQKDVASEQEEDFILFAPLGGTAAYLINRSGVVIHDWTLSGQPGNAVYLTQDGNLLATYTVEGALQGGGIGGGVELLSWDGERRWSFELATEAAHLHHDIELLPNGNVLMLSWEVKSREEALAAGLTRRQLPQSGQVWSEMILEYNPTLDEIVWEWHLWDHALPAGQRAFDHPEKIDLAFAANPNSSDWWHINAIDYNENLDQIVVSSRHVSEIWIVNHAVTTAQATGSAGDLLYRYGNPEAYGSSGIQGLLHQHNPTWLDNGNILVFDNGDPRLRPFSRVVELNLPDYTSPSHEVLPAQVVWSYGEAAGEEYFFADHISGAQRLKGGNTLICSGTEGRFFEVTPNGEIVWEYVNPFASLSQTGKESNQVFRCEAYADGDISDLVSCSGVTHARISASSLAGNPEGSVSAAPAAMDLTSTNSWRTAGTSIP